MSLFRMRFSATFSGYTVLHVYKMRKHQDMCMAQCCANSSNLAFQTESLTSTSKYSWPIQISILLGNSCHVESSTMSGTSRSTVHFGWPLTPYGLQFRPMYSTTFTPMLRSTSFARHSSSANMCLPPQNCQRRGMAEESREIDRVCAVSAPTGRSGCSMRSGGLGQFDASTDMFHTC
jgi:hypothetical protein